MDQRMLLNDWEVRYESLSVDSQYASEIERKKSGWLKTSVPFDVHSVLVENKEIPEPLEGQNSLELDWIEHKSWWLRKQFIIEEEDLEYQQVELILDGLDANATVWLNGSFIALHRSSHYPLSKDVREFLVAGNNTLLVRVTCGYESVTENDIAKLEGEVLGVQEERGDKRRVFVRKPQFVCGWDWAPRLVTAGITRSAKLLMASKVVIRDVHCTTVAIAPTALVKVKVTLENIDIVSTTETSVSVEVMKEENQIYVEEKTVLLRAGVNYIEFDVTVENPKLWWPNGYGNQELYQIKVTNRYGSKAEQKELNFGIRKITLDEDKIDDQNRNFRIRVNDVPIFCKGSNWVPADSIYARVPDDKYDHLLKEAQNQNFTMLRVWGGGIFEPDIFYELCDRYGILIWHDFMYACATYPEFEEWFMKESYKEADYQTKRLRNHACMALWCGNNEMHWIFSEERQLPFQLMKKICRQIYNNVLPEVIEKNCPEMIYRNSSPYGGLLATSEEMGDTHIWPHKSKEEVCLHDFATYDESNSKFMSEYGYTGPCTLKTVMQYCKKTVESPDDSVYRYHSHYTDKKYIDSEWYRGLTQYYGNVDINVMDQYLLYGGLTQGMVLQYSLESFRARSSCSGALIWMYDDAWGEDGWTTIDYYGRKKISYYFVKRALEPLKLICKKNGEKIQVVGINESQQDIHFMMEYGYQKFNGTNKITNQKEVSLKHHSREVVLEIESTDDLREGFFYALPQGDVGIRKAILITDYPKNLALKKAHVTCKKLLVDGPNTYATITTDTYAHAVHFAIDPDIEISDQYFDLMPNEEVTIKISNQIFKNEGQLNISSVTCD